MRWLLAFAVCALISASAEEKKAEEPKLVRLKGEFEIVCPETPDLHRVVEAIQGIKQANTKMDWMASFLKNTKRVRDLVESGQFEDASFQMVSRYVDEEEGSIEESH